ncbi:hypothetical protein DUNSADRAFT_756 [Dunaliella salina]|uniref:Guanylate cyclase domain-containing protein n=1 Tax=Dunaliella salina TaxID=3046 RepID=A0ABQ7GXY9_DUNSA|nr:hypothetical protein DUNSADRAFT_756 [Dunaliella salina]|eukprot:KAF5839470.1 hypothetical protein DUNSADRAFT_756 [Dunaliella salina]
MLGPASRGAQHSRLASQIAAKMANLSREGGSGEWHQAWADGRTSNCPSLLDSHNVLPKAPADSTPPKEVSAHNRLLLSSMDQPLLGLHGPLSNSSCIDRYAVYRDLRDLRNPQVSGIRTRSRSKAEAHIFSSYDTIEWLDPLRRAAGGGNDTCNLSGAQAASSPVTDGTVTQARRGNAEGLRRATSFNAPTPPAMFQKNKVRANLSWKLQRASGVTRGQAQAGAAALEEHRDTCDQSLLSPASSPAPCESKTSLGSFADETNEPAYHLGGHEPKRPMSDRRSTECCSRPGLEAPPHNHIEHPESEEEPYPRFRRSIHGRGRISRRTACSSASFHARSSVEDGGSEPPADLPLVYHEVELKSVTDPVTEQPAFLLIQRNASEQMMLENLLSELTEDQLAMLSQIFPRHIIQALSTDGAVTMDNIADLTCSHSDVTILFLDIVSFTATCGKDCVTPESVIVFLNYLFGQFDRLVNKYQVQKIDTIGDAYLVASGILAPDADGFWTSDKEHDGRKGAGRMVALAVDMMRAGLEVRMPDGAPVQLRIGVHTGPCVSGLVGLDVPKWSVFGDTVNTSARLEQTSLPGCIQLSEATLRLLPAMDLGLVPSGVLT